MKQKGETMENKKRLIDADALKALFDERYDDAFMQSHTRPNMAYWRGYSYGVNWGLNTIDDAPTVDAVEVVRCKDCKYIRPMIDVVSGEEDGYYCALNLGEVGFNDFCSFGERNDNG